MVQGLMSLGQEHLSDWMLDALAGRFPLETWKRILADISAAPIWIVETVRGIFRSVEKMKRDLTSCRCHVNEYDC